jgi:hypothetical protein
MARIGRHRHKKPTISDFEAFAIFLLATAEDEDDEFIAITVANLALQERRAHKFNKRYGRRGPYNRPKSEDFFRIILDVSSERIFKAWFR